jgi:uncharacterized protein YerC
MQLSKARLNRNLEKQIKEMLFGALAEINSPNKLEEVLNDLLTEAEKMAMMKRLGIAVYLDKGRNYEDIKNNLKVSSATIAAVAESIGNSGFQEMIKRIKAEEWATDWTKKITQNIKRWIPI